MANTYAQRKHDYKKRFGITVEDYDTMFAAQGGKCAICGTDDPGRGNKNFHVEHSHETGEVRGLTCHKCNQGLALFGDDANTLLAAAAYLISAERIF